MAVMRPPGPMAAVARSVCSRMSWTASALLTPSTPATATSIPSGTHSATADFPLMGSRIATSGPSTPSTQRCDPVPPPVTRSVPYAAYRPPATVCEVDLTRCGRPGWPSMSVVEIGEVELVDAIGVGEHVDRHHLPAGHGEGHDRDRAPGRGDDHAGGAVDDRRPD